MSSATTSIPQRRNGFRHEALLYAGQEEFVTKMTAFVRDGLAADEPVLVVVIMRKITLLRDALGDDARDVLFADMAEIGRNPARIIPVWREFVDARANGGAVRGIGEPIWAGRTRQEIIEAQRHESLINLAFDGAPGWILCPYDTDALDQTIVDEALRSHPVIATNGSEEASLLYRGLGPISEPFDAPLPEPGEPAFELRFEPGKLDSLRRIVSRLAEGFGLDRRHASDLVLAVNEVATNTLRHAGGGGNFRAWQDGDSLIMEVSDRGHIGAPLVGREAPAWGQERGLGLWIVNQLCDLVQIRTNSNGSVVRLHMSRR